MMIRKINKKTTLINRHLSGQVGVVRDTHFTGSHIGGDTNITSDMCTVTIIIIIMSLRKQTCNNLHGNKMNKGKRKNT